MYRDYLVSASARRFHALPVVAREALLQAGVALGLIAAVRLGMLFVPPRVNVALLWPASGVALAMIFRIGPRYLIGVAVGAFVAHAISSHALIPALILSGGTVAGSGLGAAVLRRAGVELGLARLRDVLGLLAGVVAAGTISSAVGSAVVYLAGAQQWDWPTLWWICWAADSLGALLLAPVLLTVCAPRQEHRARGPEFIAIAAAVVAVSLAVYSDALRPGIATAALLSYPALFYVVFPLLIWAAVRLEPREVALLLSVHGGMSLFLGFADHGPFAAPARESLLALYTHLTSVSASVLLLAAAMAERRGTEATLREREAEYRLLVENQTDLIMKLDPTGRILFASPKLSEQLQVPVHELVGMPARRLLERHGATAVAEAWSRILEPPYTAHFEQPLNTADGRRWIAWAAKGVLEKGKVCAVVAVGRDVTERRLADARSRQHLQELAHVGRIGAMGELAAGLAHELNQPLCAITSFSQASLRLLPADTDPDLRDAMERIASNAQRAGGIISQMRAFLRKDEQQRQATDVNHLIDEVIALTRTDARLHSVQLDLELAQALPAVELVPIQIQQVLVNLVRNSVEAMEEADSSERRIRIRSRLAGANVEVSVADSGPGLPPGLLDQLFHPFVTTKSGGMGLGLSLSRSIIEAHGGVLSAHTRAAGGSEFRFTLGAHAPGSDAV